MVEIAETLKLCVANAIGLKLRFERLRAPSSAFERLRAHAHPSLLSLRRYDDQTEGNVQVGRESVQAPLPHDVVEDMAGMK